MGFLFSAALPGVELEFFLLEWNSEKNYQEK